MSRPRKWVREDPLPLHVTETLGWFDRSALEQAGLPTKVVEILESTAFVEQMGYGKIEVVIREGRVTVVHVTVSRK